MKRNFTFYVICVAALAAAYRVTHRDKSDSEKEPIQEAVAAVDIKGKWSIENIVLSDSAYVRPDEATPGVSQYIVLDDSAYMIQTNCNTFNGPLTIKGDSIAFGPGLMTEMACDNMATEDAIRKILPNIRTVEIQNDSVIRLNGATPVECILLRKTTEKK